MLKQLLPVFLSVSLVLLGTISGLAEQGKGTARKQENIRSAIEKGILGIYDVPFDTYIRLKMWDQLERILKANAGDVVRHQLPSPYNSRPHIVNHQVWVFENSGTDIFVMTPDSTVLSKRGKNPRFAKYEGGVRTVFRETVISGGSTEDPDMAVLWNTKEDKVRTVRLRDGHHIASAAVSDNVLYIGSCGGKINAYRYDDLTFLHTYSAGAGGNSDWRIFNQKECISGIGFSQGRIVGAGDKTIFSWNPGQSLPVRTYPKTLSNSVVSFHKHYMIEHKSEDVAIRDMDTNHVRKLGSRRSIESAIITDEKVSKKQSGDVLILALKNNNGLLIHDAKTLTLIEKPEFAGQLLAALGQCIFATDDRHFYRYHLSDREPEKFRSFVKTFHPDKIRPDEETYHRLLKLSGEYPDIFPPHDLAKKFLELHRLEVRHSFGYGKIGERMSEGKQEDTLGYKLYYDVSNRSDKCYLVTMYFAWSGYYGLAKSDSMEKARSEQTFMIASHAEHKGNFVVGEKEPLHILAYPTEIITLGRPDYEGIGNALSMENEDISLIDEYLARNLPVVWKERLSERKQKLLRKRKE